MDEETLLASYKRFGLKPDASIREVELAFYKLRKLYAESSLATYSLLNDEQRQEQLAELQQSYDLILQSRLHTQSSPVDSETIALREARDSKTSRIVVVDTDPVQTPGLFLKQLREARGLTLRQLAEQTKVGTNQLESIESENFAALPAPVYLRGFLKEYCRMVKAPDAKLVIESFMTRYSESQGK